jgi:hypothetical protein
MEIMVQFGNVLNNTDKENRFKMMAFKAKNSIFINYLIKKQVHLFKEKRQIILQFMPI